MPPEPREGDSDPQARAELGSGEGPVAPDGNPQPCSTKPPLPSLPARGPLAGLRRRLRLRLEALSPAPVDMAQEEESEEVAVEDEARLVRELMTPATTAPAAAAALPLKTAREPSTVAPYGLDAPMSLQCGLRGSAESVFDLSYVPSVAQSMGKVYKRVAARIHVPYLPILNTVRKYTGEDFFHDAVAGLTCAMLVVPESLSYMVLATLDPVIGLYSASLGPFMFAFFGTAKVLSVGPISLASIYIPIALRQAGFDTDDTSDGAKAARAEAAVAFAFYVFAIFLFLALTRMGSLIRFISHSVMTGFVTATGIYVMLNELRHLLQLPAMPTPRPKYNYQKYRYLFTHLGDAHGPSAAVGLTSLAVLVGVKLIKRAYPKTPERMQSRLFRVWYYASSFTLLVVVVASAGAAYLMERWGLGMRVLGDLPAGLQAPSLPPLGKFPFVQMFSPALQVALLSYIEASSISRKYADVLGYRIDANQDLFALACCNLLSCVFGGVIVSGSFSRTALAADVGGRTPITNLFLGIFVITCVYSTHILHWIPYCTLGALIVSAMVNLVNVREFVQALRIARTSGLVMLFTFACTLILSLEDGLVYGIMASLATLLYQLSDVDTVVLGQERGPNGDMHLVSLRDNPRAVPCSSVGGVIVLRPVASLFFGNAEALEDGIQRIIASIVEARNSGGGTTNGGPPHANGGPSQQPPLSASARRAMDTATGGPYSKWPFGAREAPVAPIVGAETVGADTRFILVDASGIRLLDMTALSCVVDVVEDAHREGITVVFAGCSKKSKASLKACGLYRRVGGPLCMHSTEEVYSLLVEAPSHMPRLSQQVTTVRPPPTFYSRGPSGNRAAGALG